MKKLLNNIVDLILNLPYKLNFYKKDLLVVKKTHEIKVGDKLFLTDRYYKPFTREILFEETESKNVYISFRNLEDKTIYSDKREKAKKEISKILKRRVLNYYNIESRLKLYYFNQFEENDKYIIILNQGVQHCLDLDTYKFENYIHDEYFVEPFIFTQLNKKENIIIAVLSKEEALMINKGNVELTCYIRYSTKKQKIKALKAFKLDEFKRYPEHIYKMMLNY